MTVFSFPSCGKDRFVLPATIRRISPPPRLYLDHLDQRLQLVGEKKRSKARNGTTRIANLSRLLLSAAVVVAVTLLVLCRSDGAASSFSVAFAGQVDDAQAPQVSITDYETLSNDVLSDSFNLPFPDMIKWGSTQQQPSPDIGQASACISNNFLLRIASIAISDVQGAAAAIFSQCFLEIGFTTGSGGSTILTSNDGSGITIIFNVAPPGLAC
ncbi:hypothetical protein AYL99_03167 [Fonsecaea erecta]|uniref:Uncharacterized protein n=1 Tax=Fonsecaea erecta TaxID=1367422 RepID=A0A178ZVW3_9EURO|nr:hypothetical protein AYL99_03167 [Fonsecaea erecta]OAP63940.1 hypothetical protein AYL99_03167 [Fonsecaea erecta]